MIQINIALTTDGGLTVASGVVVEYSSAVSVVRNSTNDDLVNKIDWGLKYFVKLSDYEAGKSNMKDSFMEVEKGYSKIMTDTELDDIEADGGLARTWLMAELDTDLGGAHTTTVDPYSV